MWNPPTQIASIGDLIARVDRKVAGLKDPKAKLATAVTRHAVAASQGRDYTPINMVILGPTGGGKTYLTRTMLEESGLPFIEINATQYTEAGYHGNDLGWMFYHFIDKYADAELKPKALIPLIERWGVVVVDEFDKWRVQLNLKERQPARALQAEMLKIVEGDVVNAKQSDRDQGWLFETKNMLYIACGSFEGIGAQIGDQPSKDHMLTEPSDLVRYGFITELVGRFPNIIPLPVLQVDAMAQILREHVLPRYFQEARDFGFELRIPEETLYEIAGQGILTKTGARAFPTQLEKILWKAWSQAEPGDMVEIPITSALGGEAILHKKFLTPQPTLTVLA